MWMKLVIGSNPKSYLQRFKYTFWDSNQNNGKVSTVEDVCVEMFFNEKLFTQLVDEPTHIPVVEG